MTEITTTQGFSQRCQAVLEEARQIKANSPDWVSFFRETLGVDGVARSVFGTQNEYLQFEKTKEFEEIQKMVSALRGDKPAKQAEETKVITVRLPESLHESLKAEAAEHKTSMNKLCISKLLRALEAAAEAASLPIEQCDVYKIHLGGGFGRRGAFHDALSWRRHNGAGRPQLRCQPLCGLP